MDSLVGPRNETILDIEGVSIQTLLDSGSQVSTISEDFYLKHLQHLPLYSIEDLLEVETAGDHILPYKGYIEVNIMASEMKSTYLALVLVVPSTKYHYETPMLLGTNVIRGFLEQWNDDTKDVKAYLPTAWSVAKRCITVQDQHIRRHNGEIGIVKVNSRNHITLQSNETVTITGKVKTAHCGRQVAMVSPLKNSVLPEGVEVCPSLVKTGGDVPIVLSNLSLQTVILAPSATICQLQEVHVEDVKILEQDEDEEHPKPDIDFTETEKNLTTEEFQHFKTMVDKWESLFSTDDLNLGHTDAVKHRIKLNDERPFKDRYRRIPPGMLDELKQHLRQMLDAGVIRVSNSPWASNIVPVRKKDGKLRICIDFRELNKRTIKDAHAIPRIEEILDQLHGKTWFSVVDLKCGYWQVEVDEDDRAYTGFTVGALGMYECCRLPFGLTNSPATFQRLMQQVLGDLYLKCCTVYLDDIIIFSESYEEHLRHLELVFARIKKYNLKMNSAKCQFFRRKVKYLGHIITADGIEVDSDKTAVLKNWKPPSNVDELRSFLGFSGYFRKFVKDYAKTAKCLNDLLTGNGPPSNRKRRKNKEKSPKWNWTQEHQIAFEILIDKLMSPPILAYPDFSLPFILHTDASYQGLGAILYQKQDEKERVIGYASRGLKASEKNYPAHKLEFLAMKWAITDKFKDLLYGHQFEVVTDNNPLTYVLTSAKLDATGQRWIAELATFDFSIKYRSGKKNQDADALSRLSHESISSETVKAIGKSQEAANIVDVVTMNIGVLDQLPEADEDSSDKNYQYWRRAQRGDPVIHTVMTRLAEGQVTRKSTGNKEEKLLMKERQRLFLKRGVLYRKREENEQEIHQLVLPAQNRVEALNGLHNDIGHPGVDRTLSLVRQRFFWPNMTKDVTAHISSCKRCILRKASAATAPMVNIKTSQPLEMICIDYLTIEPSKGGIENVLVITDHFTRYAQAYPTSNQTAKTTAKVLFDNFVLHYGFPLRIHSDQGRNFESDLIQQLCKLANIEKTHTTPYHPMGNGMCERFNRTLLGLLGTLTEEQKQNWKSFVAPLVHAYNATKHESTGYSPFFLMFGRHARLPIDVVLGIPEESMEENTYSDFIADLKNRLDYTYKLASKAADVSRGKQKKHYDKGIRHTQIFKGDRVLVRKTAFKGKHKLANKWESDPYIVLEQPNPDIPVFCIREENGIGKKTLHRNLLLPIGTLPLEFEEKRLDRSSPLKKENVHVVDHTSIQEGEEESEVESEEEYVVRVLAEDDIQSEEEIQEGSETEEEPQALEETQPEEEILVDDELQDEEQGEEEFEEAEGEEDRATFVPRRSQRTSRPPQRFSDYVMQQHICNTPPKPLPRHKTCTDTVTNLSHSPQVQKPIPKPRHRKEQRDSSETDVDRKQLLQVFVGIQESQQRVQDMMLKLLTGM